ncbi:MAG: tRNA (adenosine(37)-N6)-threonylcarbamoyltransferase complex dimerization subunit type 1 TsaB [Elusimicrobiales bacterium]
MSKTILAVDSSDTPLRLAISFGGGDTVSASSADVKQERHAVRLAQKLLAERGLGLADVDRVFALRGPGRFTGIRIGLALAAVLGELNGAEVCSATVFEALARQAVKTPGYLRWRGNNPSGRLAVITSAFRSEFFCQIFSGLKPAAPPLWLPAAQLKEYLAGIKFPLYCFGWAERRSSLAPYLPENCFAAPPLKTGASAETLMAAALAAKPHKKPVAPLYLKPARFELLITAVAEGNGRGCSATKTPTARP